MLWACERYDHYRQWVTWNGARCSADALWHWFARWQCNTNYDLQITYTNLGVGNPDFPTNAPVYAVKVELDIRETAQPQNRVGRDDPRTLPADAINRTLVWANSGANTITFDVIKPPDITGPVWIRIEDLTGLNSGMPHFQRLDATSSTFTYTVPDDNDNADLLVRYGADLDCAGTLSGSDEIKGTYEVYGVTAEDYAESRNNFWFYLWGLLDLADQLNKRFVNGAFDSGDFRPTSEGTATLVVSNRLTHRFGATMTDAGFVTLAGRQYHESTMTLPIYQYADNSDASELIRQSGQLKNGLDEFIGHLSHAAIAAAYAAAPGGTTRSVVFSLDGADFEFGALGRIGLGGAGVNSTAPYSGVGTIILQMTPNGGDYDIGTAAAIDLTLHDIFDFDYFTPNQTADESRSAAMIQNGFSKPGSVANVGQVGLVEVEVDGAVTITGRTVTP